MGQGFADSAQNTYSYEVADIGYFLTHIATCIQAESTFLIGHSRGGGAVILHAKQTQTDKIALWASISDIGARFPKGSELDPWKNNGTRTILNGRTRQQLPQKYTLYEDFQKNESQLNIEAAVKSMNTPIKYFLPTLLFTLVALASLVGRATTAHRAR